MRVRVRSPGILSAEIIAQAVMDMKHQLQRARDLRREETERLLILALHTDSLWER